MQSIEIQSLYSICLYRNQKKVTQKILEIISVDILQRLLNLRAAVGRLGIRVFLRRVINVVKTK
jgi:hypothetical protein